MMLAGVPSHIVQRGNYRGGFPHDPGFMRCLSGGDKKAASTGEQPPLISRAVLGGGLFVMRLFYIASLSCCLTWTCSRTKF